MGEEQGLVASCVPQAGMELAPRCAPDGERTPAFRGREGAPTEPRWPGQIVDYFERNIKIRKKISFVFTHVYTTCSVFISRGNPDVPLVPFSLSVKTFLQYFCSDWLMATLPTCFLSARLYIFKLPTIYLYDLI